jgi:hypothetical protein
LHHHSNSVGKRCTFDKREWLIPIYIDQHRELVLMKSVQCGITDLLIVTTFAEMMRGHFVIFAQPTDADRDDVVHNRIDLSVEKSRFFRKHRGRVDNVGIKRYFGGGVLVVSTRSKTAFTGTPAQCVIIDELPKCDLDNIELARDRTAASRLVTGEEPRHIQVGNPTVKEEDIHAEYLLSSKQVYMFKCGACNQWQDLDWYKNVIRETDNNKHELIDRDWHEGLSRDIQYHCWKCNAIMDISCLKKLWVAEFPTSRVAGYHIGQLFTGQFYVRELYRDFLRAGSNPTKMQVFSNSRLGLPYGGSGVHLTSDDLRNCIDDYNIPLRPDSGTRTIGAADVGGQLHAGVDQLIKGRRKALWRGTVPDWDGLKNIFYMYNVKHAVIDARPELHEARNFQKNFKQFGVWLCEYVKADRVNTGQIREVERYDPGCKGRPTRYVQVNRTESCDDMVASIKDGFVVLPRNIMSIDAGQYAKQMKAPNRLYDEKKKQYVWTENGKDDHYFHVEVYLQVGARRKNFLSEPARIITL